MDAILNFDWAIFQWISNNLWSPALDGMMKVITTLGDSGIIWIVFGLALVCFKKYRKVGIMVLAALLFSLIFTDLIIKPLVHRPRPFDLPQWFGQFVYPEIISRPGSLSFPSGHTSSSFAAASVLWFTRRKWQMSLLATVLAILIAFSRVYLYVHYPTDVLAGILAGITYGYMAYLLVAALEPVLTQKLGKQKKQRAGEDKSDD